MYSGQLSHVIEYGVAILQMEIANRILPSFTSVPVVLIFVSRTD